MRVTRAEFGVKLSEAYKHFCRPDIREEFLRAGTVAGWNTRHARIRVGGLTYAQKQRKADVAAYKVADSMVLQDIFSKLNDGRLVATGFVIGQQGRDPDGSRRRIPADVLRSPNRRVEWRGETISGNGLTFVDVRLCPTLEVPGAEEALIGCSLSECFKKVVTDDWLRREKEDPVFCKFPDWKFDAEHFYLIRPNRWLVRFEDWRNPAHSVADLISPAHLVGGPRPIPPQEIVAIRERVEGEARRLITWFRDGTLVTEGTKEPPDHVLTRERIVQDWWSRVDVEMDITDSALRIGRSTNDRLIFSEIRIIAPESAQQEPVDKESKRSSSRQTRRGGRPLKWHRDEAIREVQRFAKERGGWDCPFSVFENHLKDWFFKRYGNHPSDSTVRRYVREALSEDWCQNQS